MAAKPKLHPPRYLHSYEKLMEQIFMVARDSEVNEQDMKIYGLLTELLILLMEDAGPKKTKIRRTASRQNLQELKEYLDHHYAEKISLDDLSARFFLNKFYLTRVFKEQFGMTINNYLVQVRMTHAKQLLRFSGKTLEQISMECGMTDANYMTRIFKKMEGTTPGAYRKMWSANQ